MYRASNRILYAKPDIGCPDFRVACARVSVSLRLVRCARQPTILDDLSRVAKLQIGSGGPPALRKAPSEADADEEDFTPPGTPPDDTDLERVGNDEDFVPKQVRQGARVRLVVARGTACT